MQRSRSEKVKRRHLRIRRKIKGTSERPRLCVHRSLKHLYAQLVDDNQGVTIAFATTNTKSNKAEQKSFSNKDAAKKLGAEIAEKAKEKGVETVVFDRGGNSYHGVLSEFAGAAREAGLKF